MKRKIHLVSFYGVVGESENFQNTQKLFKRQELLNRTAIKNGGVNEVHSWNLDKLSKTKFYAENESLLTNPRGCGYWAWKPFIILETLKLINDEDYVVYCDIGRPSPVSSVDHGNQITHSLVPLTEWAEKNGGFFPGVYLAHHGPASKWIKQDCFTLMDCDTDEYKEMPTIQAGYTAWKKTDSVIRFLEQWLEYNKDERLITDIENTLDKENSSDFVRHCHDQATLTLLCEKNNISAFGQRKQQFWGFRNINFISKKVDWELRKKQGSLLFSLHNSNADLLPTFLNSWIELLFEYRCKDKLNIHLISEDIKNTSTWGEYLNNSVIRNFALKDKDAQYDLVVTRSMDKNDYTIDHFFEIFKSVKEGGLAVIGPFPNTDNANELMSYCRQIANQEVFLEQFNSHDLSDKVKEVGPAKIPNSKNPVFLKTANKTFALFYKPVSLLMPE